MVRCFSRTVGEVEIEYCSLDISYLSVESLIWVIRSIKADRMTPNEKLILSRVKECFDIKVHNKLWQNILTYLSSKKYTFDHDKMSLGNPLPRILLTRASDEYLLSLSNEEWPYEDQ